MIWKVKFKEQKTGDIIIQRLFSIFIAKISAYFYSDVMFFELYFDILSDSAILTMFSF